MFKLCTELAVPRTSTYYINHCIHLSNNVRVLRPAADTLTRMRRGV